MPIESRRADRAIVRVVYEPREACVIILSLALEPKAFDWAKLCKTEVGDRDCIVLTLDVEKERMHRGGWGYNDLPDQVALTLKEEAYEVATRNNVPCSLRSIIDPMPF